MAPRPDLLIVARGGGSIEDLWGFNEEAAARAAAESDIPLISAVGHETDTTLIDFVSDARAPTPTAAAEMAVPVRRELIARLEETRGRLLNAMTSRTTRADQRLRDLARALPHPSRLTANARQRWDVVDQGLPRALTAAVARKRVRLADVGAPRLAMLKGRLGREGDRLAQRVERNNLAVKRLMERKGTQIDGLARLLGSLGYQETLARGYAVVRGDGKLVTTKGAAEKSRSLEIEFADGKVAVGGRAATKSKPPTPDQGSLF